MPNLIWDYLNLLGVGTHTRGAGRWSDADSTVPFDNEFYLLGLDESASDAEVAAQAKASAQSASRKVYDRGQAHHNKRIDILIRDQINQAGERFDGKPEKVAEHRQELNARRSRQLNEIARVLSDSGNWSSSQGDSMLRSVATAIGVAPDYLDCTVSAALLSAGQWTAAPAPAKTPVSITSAPTAVPDAALVGGVAIPLWVLMPPIGILLGMIDPRAGVAFGSALALVAFGKWNAARAPHGVAG